MKTRVSLSMVLLLVILLVAVSAQATSPSITTDDLYDVVSVTSDPVTTVVETTTGTTTGTGNRGTRISNMPVPLAGPFTLEIAENIPEVLNELKKITDFLQETGRPIIDYFDYSVGNKNEELRKQIMLLLPADVDPDTLVMNEFVTVESILYTEDIGDVLATLEFPTKYREDQIIVGVVGIFDDEGNVEWVPLKAETVKGDDDVIRVQIHFTQEALTKIDNKQFALAILNEP